MCFQIIHTLPLPGWHLIEDWLKVFKSCKLNIKQILLLVLPYSNLYIKFYLHYDWDYEYVDIHVWPYTKLSLFTTTMITSILVFEYSTYVSYVTSSATSTEVFPAQHTLKYRWRWNNKIAYSVISLHLGIELSKLRLVLLPPQTTSVSQPLDQGIMKVKIWTSVNSWDNS